MAFEPEETKLWEAALWDGPRSKPASTRLEEVFVRRHDALRWLIEHITHECPVMAVYPSAETRALAIHPDTWERALDAYERDMAVLGQDEGGWYVRRLRALRYVKESP